MILRLTSRLRIISITLSRTDEDGILAAIRVSTSSAYGPYLVNLMIVLRIAYYVSITCDRQFKWLAQGQFTMDATLFVIGLVVSSICQGIHLKLLRSKHEFASAGNAVLKINMEFAGMRTFTLHPSWTKPKMFKTMELYWFY